MYRGEYCIEIPTIILLLTAAGKIRPYYYTKEELLNEVLEGKPIIYAEKVTDVPESVFPTDISL